MSKPEPGFAALQGATINRILSNGPYNDDLYFDTSKGIFRMYHWQECCEQVSIEDVDGNLADIIGVPILLAEESAKEDETATEAGDWTFYKLATIRGDVTIRWYGSSNGYYSTSAMVECATSIPASAIPWTWKSP